MKTAWFLAGLLAGTVCAEGFVNNVDSAGNSRRWNLLSTGDTVDPNVLNPQTHAIRYYIASDAYSTTNREAELNAVRASFAQWQAVPGTILKFEEAGFVAPGVDINTSDNTNVVFWVKNSTTINGGLDNISGALGFAYYAYLDDNSLVECDIVLNGAQFRWATITLPSYVSGVFFIESVLVHEIGHLIGLDHSPVGGATMLARGESGSGTQAGLSSDEISAVRWLYPDTKFAATLSELRGNVTANGKGLFGAVVLVEDASGNVVAGTVTLKDGSYHLPGLPAGNVQARVCPLDPTGGSDTSALLVGWDIGYDFAASDTMFKASTPTPIALISGQNQVMNFSFTPVAPEFRITRLRPPTDDPHLFVLVNSPLSLTQGQSNLIIGVYSPDFPGGADFWISGTGVTLDNLSYNTQPFPGINLRLISGTVRVAPDAVPGMRSLIVQSGDQIAYANGFLNIAATAPDHNFDGLDDRFQRQYFPLWTAAEAGPTADPDGDGLTNLEEYRLGTNPHTFDIFLRMDYASTQAGKLRLSWKSQPGKKYQLQYSPAPGNGNWQNLSTPLTGTGNTMEWFDPIQVPGKRCYRIELTP